MLVLALSFAAVVVAALIIALWLTRNAIPNSYLPKVQMQTLVHQSHSAEHSS